MTAAACLTLAAVHLQVWSRQRARVTHLAFAMTAAFFAAVTPFELSMARAQTPAQFASTLRWTHLPGAFAVVSLIWFLWLHFGTGRLWLACAAAGGRILAAIVNFVVTPNLNYRAITGLKQVSIIGGEHVSSAVGVVSPLALIGQLSNLFLLLYVLDATVTLWRRGGHAGRRRAAVVGGSLLIFILLVGADITLVMTGMIVTPMFLTFPFLITILAMGHELSLEVVQAGQLSLDVKTSEERLALAQEAGHIGTFDLDLRTGRVRWTEQLESIYGFARGGFGGSLASWRERVHPQDILRCEAEIDEAIAHQREGWHTQYRILRAGDGEVRWIDAWGRIFLDGKARPVRMLGVNVDITGRKQADDAQNSLAAIVASSDDAILGKTLDGTITTWNAGAAKMYGYTAREMVGQPVSTLAPADLREEVQHILEQISRGETVDHLETVRVTKDGRRLDVSLMISPITDGRGKIVGASTIARDITARKRDERALQSLTGRLLMLQDAERQRVAGELHDGLGQSLAIIKNRAAMALRDQTPQDLVLEQLAEIQATATSAILEVRQIAHNLRPYELDRLGLIAAIESMIERISDSSSIALSADLEPIAGLLSPDAETSVYRMVQEGLSNVIKHSQAAAGRIEIKKRGTQLVISVQDDGNGMPPPAPPANGNAKRGFGLLGMAERVRSLNGTLAIDSLPARGTTLTICLEIPCGSGE
jgi:PAS domain S-box-containing protein